MGQGAESVPGGYDCEYSTYFDDKNIGLGLWPQKNGYQIKIEDMADSHIKNCVRLVRDKMLTANCEYDQEVWGCWLSSFESELFERAKTGKSIKQKFVGERKKRKPNKTVKQVLKCLPKEIKKIDMQCHCGNIYAAKVADLKRGWSLSCSKSCAATRKTYNKQPAKPYGANNEN